MSALGLGMVGLNSFFDQQRRLEQYDYGKEKRAADLSMAPDRDAAERSAYQLREAQNNAGLELVEPQTETVKAGLGNLAKGQALRGSELDAAKTRQPDDLAALANKSSVAKTLSEFDVENLPRAIAAKKMQGAFTDADVYTASVVKLSDLLATNDQNAVIRFMNGMNDSGVFGKKHSPVAAVAIQQDPATNEAVFVATDADGKPVMQMGASQMKRIRNSIGKTEFKTVNAGDSLVALKDGQATPVYTAPESAKNLIGKKGPLERDVGYLVSQHGMTQEQALAHLNSAKTMTREQFILKSVQDSVAMGKKPNSAEVSNFGMIYDSALQAGSAQANPASPATQPPAADGTYSPWRK